MKKYFLLILVSFFFLGGCGEDEMPGDEMPGDQEPAKAEPEVPKALEAQACWKEISFASWRCGKEGEKDIWYRVAITEGAGTLNTEGCGSAKECVDKLNAEVKSKKDEGWKCNGGPPKPEGAEDC